LTQEISAREKFYQNRIQRFEEERKTLKTKRSRMPWLRFVSFIGFVVSFYLAFVDQPTWWWAFGPFFIGFIAFSLMDRRLRSAIRRVEFHRAQNDRELQMIQKHSFEGDDGTEFHNPEHSYSADLDLFGERSLFHFLDRTTSHRGRARLAHELNHAFDLSAEAEQRQQAIAEWSTHIDVMHEVRYALHRDDEHQTTQWDQLLQIKDLEFGVYNILRYAFPALVLSVGGLSAFGFLSSNIFFLAFVAQLLISGQKIRQFLKMSEVGTKGFSQLAQFAAVIQIIESQNFNSTYNRTLVDRLKVHNKPASQSISGLSGILSKMDSQNNVIVTVLLNGLFMWNIHLMFALRKWVREFGDHLEDWIQVVAEFEALHSLANLHYNFPNATFPEVQRDDFVLDAQNLGHPLIAEDERVDNSIRINHWNTYVIITGANMSGKSTFLRSVGVNLILGMIGSVVFAEKMRLTPIPIHSSIRTSDSLARSESYFYAELKRLAEIVKSLERGERKLILLDEILKGTNSKDKQEGSIALIEKLLKYPSVGFFATHDLALGTLADKYPNHVMNRSFEISIQGDQMEIDYKLREGVCKNLNAAFLMHKMGIVDDN